MYADCLLVSGGGSVHGDFCCGGSVHGDFCCGGGGELDAVVGTEGVGRYT